MASAKTVMVVVSFTLDDIVEAKKCYYYEELDRPIFTQYTPSGMRKGNGQEYKICMACRWRPICIALEEKEHEERGS